MTDVPALIVNFGILIVSGVAAMVAVVQARSAVADAKKAEKARDAALKAQTDAATALGEANRIAAEARDIMEGQDARSRERHSVKWTPMWNYKEGLWILSNDGPDTAADVRLTVQSPTIGSVVKEASTVEPQRGPGVTLPHFKGAGGMPRMEWRVEWRTPLGAHREESGVWPLR